MTDSRLPVAWDAARDRYDSMDNDWARFNVALLTALRVRWESRVRPDTSMFTLLFTRPNETGYRFTERVRVEYEPDRVAMSLERDLPRQSLSQSGGLVVVAGDFTRPENAIPAVEALLYQLAGDHLP
jgi:hypothetical protein